MPLRILTTFAHPDDAECIAGGTLLRWATEGHHITICLITNGDKGTTDAEEPSEAVAARRRREQEHAAARLGADLVWLGYEDGYLQPTLELRRDLVRIMRRVRPDRVVANDPTVWFRHATYVNHPDHRAAGQAALEALYPAVKKPGIFPELLEEGLEPHVIEEVWLGATDDPNVWVDIDSVLEDKISLICEHASQFPPDLTRRAFTRLASESGAPKGLGAAESFRVVKLVRQTVRALAGDSDG